MKNIKIKNILLVHLRKRVKKIALKNILNLTSKTLKTHEMELKASYL